MYVHLQVGVGNIGNFDTGCDIKKNILILLNTD